MPVKQLLLELYKICRMFKVVTECPSRRRPIKSQPWLYRTQLHLVNNETDIHGANSIPHPSSAPNAVSSSIFTWPLPIFRRFRRYGAWHSGCRRVGRLGQAMTQPEILAWHLQRRRVPTITRGSLPIVTDALMPPPAVVDSNILNGRKRQARLATVALQHNTASHQRTHESTEFWQLTILTA